MLAAGTVVAGAGTGAAAGGAAACTGSGPLPYTCAQPGDLIDVRLGELHPTQAVLGFDQVFYKLGRYGSDRDEAAGGVNKRFDDWCETNGQEEAATAGPGARLDDPSSFSCTVPLGQETPGTIAPMKTAVVGPGGKLYLTDGHHTLTSFLEGPDGSTDLRIRLRVTDNFSSLSTPAFWQRMTEQKKVWLRDENNRPLGVDRLPDRLGITHFRDDPYRSLVYFTRDIGYEVPDGATEFLEFSWGAWLRGEHDVSAYDLTAPGPYLDLVKGASKSMAALAPTRSSTTGGPPLSSAGSTSGTAVRRRPAGSSPSWASRWATPSRASSPRPSTTSPASCPPLPAPARSPAPATDR
ncbi:hypothetical protein SPW_1152 [Streptomyces sp. W007]|nr:hypothetical protein SPW_1152 [Streptomyces sp. W007]